MWKNIKNFLNKIFNISIESANQPKITLPETPIISETLMVEEEPPKPIKQPRKRKISSKPNQTKSVIKSLKK